MHSFHCIMLEKQMGNFKSANCSDCECLYTAICLKTASPSTTTSVRLLMSSTLPNLTGPPQPWLVGL